VTESNKGLKGLKAHAETTMFADFRVTPELKERLRRRLREVELRGEEKRRRPWTTWTWAAGAVATAAFLIVVGQGVLSPDRLTKEESSAGAPGMATDSYGGREMARGAAPPAMPTPMPASAPAPQMQFTAKDQDGARVTLTAGAVNANGNSVAYSTLADETMVAGTTSANVSGPEAQPGRKIIYNAEYSLKVADATAAMEKLQLVATSSGGYVVDATMMKAEDGSQGGHVVLRIPSGRYSDAAAEVRKVGEVRTGRQWTNDVTERYMDMENRIRIQQEFEQKLQQLAAKAEKFEDWLKLTQQMNETRANIESMQGQIKLLSNQVEYATISVGLNQPAPGQPQPKKPDESLGSQMYRSFVESVKVMVDGVRSLLVGLAAVGPFVLTVVVVGGAALAGYWIRRRALKKKSQG